MKTYLVLTVAVLAFAGVAFAGTIAVPLFRDGGGAMNASYTSTNGANRPDGSPSIAGGPASYIGVKNLTGSALVVALTYTDPAGLNHTPVKNTFLLSAQQGLAWRPVFDDPIDEGPQAAAIPNMASAPSNGLGSVVLTWKGQNSNVVGRYLEYSAAGAGNNAMYTLPNLSN